MRFIPQCYAAGKRVSLVQCHETIWRVLMLTLARTVHKLVPDLENLLQINNQERQIILRDSGERLSMKGTYIASTIKTIFIVKTI